MLSRFELDLVSISGGHFTAGSDSEEVERCISTFGYAFRAFASADVYSWFSKQVPQQACSVAAFRLGRFLVTNQEFGRFELAVIGHSVRADISRPTCPVEGVSYFQARAYCQWLADETGIGVRLPTEREWEFAASSGGRYRFPWGDEFDPHRVNTAEAGPGVSTPVDSSPSGRSVHGFFDLAGNVEEWTDTIYLPYAGGTFVHDHISSEAADFYPLLRGGCYRHHGDLCLAARRHGFRPNYTVAGFRIAV